MAFHQGNTNTNQAEQRSATRAGDADGDSALVASAGRRTARFTHEEWTASNVLRCRHAEDQQQMADRIMGECIRIKAEAAERTELMRETSERRLKERISDVNFDADELNRQREQVCLELEALAVYADRLRDCLASLQQNAMEVCRKCLILRDGRVGIDLVVDEVEEQLNIEISTIVGGQSLLRRALEQLREQTRRLRAARHSIDRDLQDKFAAADIDQSALLLTPTHPDVALYEGCAQLDPSKITAEEWSQYSANNIKTAAKEVTSARPIRVFIDTLLQQVIEDLWDAYDKCNKAFLHRIEETKKAKARLEDMHSETVKKVMAMQRAITELSVAISEKRGSVALAQTRLARRAARPGAELVKDAPALAVQSELGALAQTAGELEDMLNEANSSLRYLLQTQVQLEEDINVKMNSLKIDEVDCMTLRQTMDYHAY